MSDPTPGAVSKIERIRAVLDDHDYPSGALYDIRQILDAEPESAPKPPARTPYQLAADELFQWNTPDNPYFIVTGRRGEVGLNDEDPYLPIVRAVFQSIAMVDLLTSEPALAAFREAWQQADAEGATGDRVRRGMVAAIEAVS